MKWFVGALILLCLALVFRLGLVAYAMYALLIVMVVSRLLSENWIRNLSAIREINRSMVSQGDKVAVVVRVKNQGTLPIPWVLMEDLLPPQALLHNPPNLQQHGRRVKLSMIWGGQEITLAYQLTCNRRGYYQLGPLVVETGDLFGLHRRYRVATEPLFLLVLPKQLPLDGYEISSRRPIGEIRMTHRLYEDPTRIAGVRAYEPGDPLNRVHWGATARTGQLHSKIYEPSSIAGATLLLDMHRDSHDRKHEPYRSELAITATASIAQTIYEMQQQVGLVTNGRDAADRVKQEGWQSTDYRTRKAAKASAGMNEESTRLKPIIVPTQRGPVQLGLIRETLARLELTDGLNFSQLLSETTSQLPRDATVIAILATITEETALALVNLRKRGFQVSVVLNLYDEWDFAQASGLLLSTGITTHHLKDENHINQVCRQYELI